MFIFQALDVKKNHRITKRKKELSLITFLAKTKAQS
jgi:hypothetical protein